VKASEAQVETLRGIVAPAVAALGLDLYDVELLGGVGSRTLRVTISRPGGVDLDAITEATRAISPAVDAADAVSGSYLLEVSSPGVERALRVPDHYRGALGEQVSVKFHTSDGPRRVRGTLVDADDAHVVVENEAGERNEIGLADVTQARTVFEWGPQPKHARAKGK
jgi:ribosome maturation factor RimP